MSKDCRNNVRVINEDFKIALEGGILKPVTEMVKNSGNLLMCFRGKYINVYYRGHSLFKIEQMGKEDYYYYKVSFDFNHARFTKEWDKVLELLEAIGYSLNHKNHDICNKKNKVSAIVDPEDIDFWNKSKEIFSKLIDDYFSVDEDKLYDYFKICKIINKNKFIEKQRQQKIAMSNTNCDNGYFIYDIEYTQARDSKEEKNSGRFDMLAMRFENKVPVELVLIELKSTKSACTSGSGIKKHYEDLTEYSNNLHYINVRKREAIAIFNLYSSLNIISANRIDDVVDLNVKILFIFTDEAKTCFSPKDIPDENKIAMEDENNVIK